MRWFTQHDRASWCGRRKSNIQPRKSLSRYSNCVSLLWLEQQFHQKDSGEWEAEHRCDPVTTLCVLEDTAVDNGSALPCSSMLGFCTRIWETQGLPLRCPPWATRAALAESTEN